MPGRRDFPTRLTSEGDPSENIVDSPRRIGRLLPTMALNAPYLPPNPLRPRAFGGLGAEGGWERKILATG